MGNSSGEPAARRRSAVYPHARGELPARSAYRSRERGLSPRPWGTLLGMFATANPFRFIPTPVGNSPHSLLRPCHTPVYPHARGELTGLSAQSGTAHGLSPRPWGTRSAKPRPDQLLRFIPTPVGNSISDLLRSCRYTVYPHARGELSGAVAANSGGNGLSPRPWGTPRLANLQQI